MINEKSLLYKLRGSVDVHKRESFSINNVFKISFQQKIHISQN